MQAARYALRSEQIPDRVLCQRSALVIGADEFRSFHRVNVLNATRMIGREKADRTRSLSPHRFDNAQHRINILLVSRVANIWNGNPDKERTNLSK